MCTTNPDPQRLHELSRHNTTFQTKQELEKETLLYSYAAKEGLGGVPTILGRSIGKPLDNGRDNLWK